MLLTSTEDLVRWWKEHFEDVLNPIVTPSIIKVESGEEGDDSPITDVVTAQWQGPWVGLGTPDQLFILSRIFEGVRPAGLHVFLWTWTSYLTGSLRV